MKELQSLCLDVRVLDKNNEEIDLKVDLDDDYGFGGSERNPEYNNEENGSNFENVAVDSEFEDNFAIEQPDLEDEEDDLDKMLDEFSDLGLDDDDGSETEF